MGIQITLVSSNDWQGLYVSQKLVLEGHTIGISAIMKYVLHNHVDSFEQYVASDNWVETTGSFTPALCDVVLEDGRTIQEHWEIPQ